MHLLYLSDISQLDYVRLSDPGLLEHARVLTADISVATELERYSIEFIDEWDFLSAADIEENWNHAYRLSLRWWDELFGEIDSQYTQLSKMAKQDWVYSLEACLNARTAYSKIFAQFHVTEISGFFLPQIGVVRTGPVPTNRAVRSVTHAVLFYLADASCIPIRHLVSPRPLTKSTISQPWWRPIHTVWEERGEEALDLGGSTRSTDKLVLVYEAAMPAAELVAVREAVSRMPGVRMLSLSQSALEFFMTDCHADSIGTGTVKNLRTRLLERMKEYSGKYSEVFSNPHLAFQFERVFDEMQRASDLGDCFGAVLELLQPSLVLFAHEAFTIERVLVAQAQSRMVPTAALIHGGIRFKFGARGVIGDADHVLAWSQSDAQWFEDFGVDPRRIVQIGCIRYAQAYEKYADTSRVLTLADRKVAKRSLQLNQDQAVVVLVTAEINTGLAAPVAHAKQHRAAIQEFLIYVGSHPEIQFVIKAHPTYDYYEWYRRLASNGPSNLMFVEQAKLSDVMRASDVCVMINYCTTASLDAMFHQIPVLFYDADIYPLRAWCDNLDATGLCRFHSISSLVHAIEEVLTNEDTRNAMCLDFANQVERVLGVSTENPIERLHQFLQASIQTQGANRLSVHMLLDTHSNGSGALRSRLQHMQSNAPYRIAPVAERIVAYDLGYSGWSNEPLIQLRMALAELSPMQSMQPGTPTKAWRSAFTYGIIQGKRWRGGLLHAISTIRLFYSEAALRRQVFRYLLGILVRCVHR